MRTIMLCVAAATIMGADAPRAFAQQTPAGKYDGKYTTTIKCFPTGNFRYTSITIRGDAFRVSFQLDGDSRKTCPIKINADGTFSNQTCDAPTTGKIVGDKLEFSFNAGRLCDITGVRDKG